MKRLLILLALALVPSLAAFAQEREAPFDERERETGERVRREYLEQLREHGIDAAGIRAEWQAMSVVRAKHSPEAPAGSAWEFLGPKNQSGRIMGIAVAADDPQLWYCAADGGGIWKSVNGGDSWTPLTDTLPSLRMGVLGMSPFDKRIVIGITHEGLVYRTADGGATWGVITPANLGYPNELQFHPTMPGVVYACSGGGLFKSTDNGLNWTNVRSDVRISSIEFDSTHAGTILIAATDANGNAMIYRSTNGGTTWSQTLKRPSGSSNVRVRLCASRPSVGYASFPSESAIFKTLDSGRTWNALAAQPYRDGYNRGFDFLVVDPGNPDIVFTGSTGIFRTMDGGATWTGGDTVNKDLHVDQHAVLFPGSIPGTLIWGNDGGIFASSTYRNARPVWVNRNHDLATLQIYNCALHPRNADTVIVGCQDNGYDKYSGDEYSWLVVGGDGFCTIYDRRQPGNFYHEYIYQNLHRADNGFTWWSAKKMGGLPTDSTDNGFYTGIVSPDRCDWYGQAVAISPADGRTLYMGTNHLYKSADTAEHWSRVNDAEYGDPDRGDYITFVAPSNGTRVYAGTQSGKVYRVEDTGPGGDVGDITPFDTQLGRVRGIAVSPSDPDVAYVCGDGGYGGRGVVTTSDHGASWHNVSNGLPHAGVNRIMMDPDSAGTLYAGTTVGLFYTRDGGGHWYPMPGLPNVEVWDLAFHEASRTLLLGTYGRGAVRARGFVPPAAPFSGVSADPVLRNGELRVVSDAGGERVLLRTAQDGNVAVMMYDGLGRAVASLHDGPLPAGEHQFMIGTEATLNLAAGVYFVVARGAHVQAACSFPLVH
ncbi:MAG: hypothetical protein JST22_07300 [Bacteroidetes bacterium]|nr:hypothetical protein [Bacteroidota bacterium]